MLSRTGNRKVSDYCAGVGSTHTTFEGPSALFSVNNKTSIFSSVLMLLKSIIRLGSSFEEVFMSFIKLVLILEIPATIPATGLTKSALRLPWNGVPKNATPWTMC